MQQPVVSMLVPGKMILSGEHAVVYGKPALAMAVDRYVTTIIAKKNQKQISFDFADLAYKKRLRFDTLYNIKDRIKRKYKRFLAGDYTIRQVLQKPFELAQYVISQFAEPLHLTLPQGLDIHLSSTIPMGCGMGSSAATIVGVMHAICDYLHLQMTDEALFKLAREAENAQHGQSSGIDIYMASRGGCHYFHGETILARPLPTMPIYLINTGKPKSTTGECVVAARPYFAKGSMADDFAMVTQAMDQVCQQAAWHQLPEAVRANHRLLTAIAVVPAPVQRFIAAIEASGGAAKICGAGASRGAAAGMVWALVEDKAYLATLCREYGYELLTIAGEAQGVRKTYSEDRHHD